MSLTLSILFVPVHTTFPTAKYGGGCVCVWFVRVCVYKREKEGETDRKTDR